MNYYDLLFSKKLEEINNKIYKDVYEKMASKVADTLPKGNTTQFSTTGKNLLETIFKNTTQYGLDFSYDDGIITINGTSTNSGVFNLALNLEKELESGTYTYIFQYISGNQNGGAIRLAIGDTDMNIGIDNTHRYFTIVSNSLNSQNIVDSKTLTENKIINTSRAYINKDITFTNFKFRIFLVKGTYTADNIPDYEPYTGGQPSPNPDFPQDIVSITGTKTFKVTSNEETKDFSIPFGTVELNGIEDYKDSLSKVDGKWIKNENFKSIIFDGTESWRKHGTNNGDIYMITIPESLGYDYNLNKKAKAFCNSFISKALGSFKDDTFGVFGINAGGEARFFTGAYGSHYPTLEKWKQFLSNEFMKLIYQLKVPTKTTITDITLTNALDTLVNYLIDLSIRGIDYTITVE